MFDNVISTENDEPPRSSTSGAISISKPSVPALVAAPALPAVASAITLSAAASTLNRDYPVADLVGRCFLRVCYWVDIVDSWRRKKRLPASFEINGSTHGDFPAALDSKENKLIYDGTAALHPKLKP